MKIIESFKRIDWKSKTTRRVYIGSFIASGGLYYLLFGRHIHSRKQEVYSEAFAKQLFLERYPELKDKYVDPLSKRIPKKEESK